MKKRLFILVEIIPYACIKREKVNKFIKSVVLMKNDYIFVADIDFEHSVRDKKQILYYRFSEVDGSRIVIVIREIESWYYAGISGTLARELGIMETEHTNDLTKEDFNARIPKKFDSRIDFMFEILKSFSLETAARKNTSFHFFVERYHLEEKTF